MTAILAGLACLLAEPPKSGERKAPVESSKPPQLSPQRVRLVGSMSFQQALAILNEQLQPHGNHLVDLRPLFGQRPDDPRGDYDLRDVSYWEAADRLAELAHLRLVILPPQKERGMLVGFLAPAYAKPPARPPIAYCGPFRVAVSEIQAIRQFDEPNLSRLELTLELGCEPRYLPIWLQLARDSVRYREANSQEIVAEQTAQGAIKWLDEGALRWRIRLPLPERSRPNLESLTVHGIVLVAPKRLTARVSPLAPGKPMRVEDVQVAVQEADLDTTHEYWRFRVQLAYPQSDGRRGFDLESYHTWIMDSTQITLQRQGTNAAIPPVRTPVVSVENSHTFSLEVLFSAPEKVSPANSRDWSLHLSFLATPWYVPLHAEFASLPLP